MQTNQAPNLTGRVTQVIGPVVDVEFSGELPEIFTALKVTNPSISSEPENLTIRRPTLEDVFLALTGRALRD